ncbi:MAG TPA: response regulator [Verrucomicrobiae bacterium]|nr:response regulator [Verrucomicrobiae bacterium]
MKRVLFVDDEPRILEGLQRMLRPQRNLWEMDFASSGQDALSMMEAGSYDVVVTDMRMPRMDGARLLDIVREKYPGTLRIVLSGYTELESSYRAVPVAHQFLLKPCDAEKLCSAIERGTCLTDLLKNKALAGLIGSLRALPSAPGTYLELQKELESPEPSIVRIVTVIEKDVAIAAKVLQLVNSAFFGIPRDVTDIQTAVTLIGSNILHHLVLSVEAFRAFRPDGRIPGFSLDEFDAHSQLAARIAAGLSEREGLSKGIVVAAFLHDIGQLVVAERAPVQMARALDIANREHLPFHQVEERLFGISHAEVGAYLLALWGLPYPVIEAIAHHHQPRRARPVNLDLVTGVYIANILASQAGRPSVGAGVGEVSEFDSELLDSLHIAGRIPGWREMAEILASQMQGVKP